MFCVGVSCMYTGIYMQVYVHTCTTTYTFNITAACNAQWLLSMGMYMVYIYTGLCGNIIQYVVYTYSQRTLAGLYIVSALIP